MKINENKNKNIRFTCRVLTVRGEKQDPPKKKLEIGLKFRYLGQKK